MNEEKKSELTMGDAREMQALDNEHSQLIHFKMRQRLQRSAPEQYHGLQNQVEFWQGLKEQCLKIANENDKIQQLKEDCKKQKKPHQKIPKLMLNNLPISDGIKDSVQDAIPKLLIFKRKNKMKRTKAKNMIIRYANGRKWN